MVRRYNQEQLEKKYAQEINDYDCISYFDYVYELKSRSCEPMNTFKSELDEMNRECKKAFLWWLYNNEQDLNDVYRLIHITIQAL